MTDLERAQHMHRPRGSTPAHDMDLMQWDRAVPDARPLVDEVQFLRDEVNRFRATPAR